jgi:hypothetical protein
MKKIFYLSITALIIFEVLNVYFIMPFPKSQRINSIDAAYYLHNWRWAFRVVFGFLIFFAGYQVVKSSKWHLLALIPLIAVAYLFNFQLSADKMFLQPKTLVLKNAAESVVDKNRLVVGIEQNGEARAYPIQYIAYHHQVRDTLAGAPIMVTYCTVCRSGRVYEPLVGGKAESFRLVGMDKFNAMFEDSTTKSWWRQANGQAVAGALKGQMLPELETSQTTLHQWLELYPESLIMQPDDEFAKEYENYRDYENGKGGELTGTNANSWQDKSWVVGISAGDSAKAFDWNKLKSERIINDEVGKTPVVLFLAADDKSFFAFERPNKETIFEINDDKLFGGQSAYDMTGKSLNSSSGSLKKINAYQEFWHSWRSFHPNTEK